MNKSDEILRKLRELTASLPVILSATVTAVDRSKQTCDVVLSDDLEMFGVRLKSAVDENTENGVVVYPAENSDVLIARMNKSPKDFYVIGFGSIEDIIINGGANGGMCIAPTLTTELAKLTARVDIIIDAINAGTPATGTPDSGAALIASIKTVLATIGQKEDFSEIENEKVKH